MAYMMQHLRMGLMDAYLMTRARRLNGPLIRALFLDFGLPRSA